MKIILAAVESDLADAWDRHCGDLPDVIVHRGSILELGADAVVSPANSFGFMDGGIDAVYTYQFGEGLQQRLQALIAAEYGGELPIGMAVVVPTMHADIPWCISAPTMRIPRDVSQTVNAYLAFRAALRAVLAHNASGRPPIERVLCPGLGTAVGKMPVARCARQMRAAWDRVLGARTTMPRSIRTASAEETELLR